MGQILLFIIAVVVIVVGFVLLVSRRARETAVGVCASALDRTVRKNSNKEKALTFLRERARSTSSGQGEAGNEEIREYLDVSRQSVARYMTELEREGKVEQIGDIGRGVIYRLR